MYDHYIALDWAQSNMAVARLTKNEKKLSTFEGKSSVSDLIVYLKNLKGSKILTFEESTGVHWLYTELKDFVDKVIVCDPRRNRLLSEGAKNDVIDAIKLVKLLKADVLKEVYHAGDQFIYLRRIVSGYEDVIKAGVRLKNQRASLLKANGLSKKDDGINFSGADRFVLEGLNTSIASYEHEKDRYKDEIDSLCRQHKLLRNLKTLPGINDIGAIKIAARVVDPKRFSSKGRFLSFCGQVKHEKISGGKSYGKKKTNYCRELKKCI